VTIPRAIPSGQRTGLVLCGGGARGAYEAGVIAYLRHELEPELGRSLSIPIIAGTSVGAINACHMATHAHVLSAQPGLLIDRWKSLHVQEVLKFGVPDVLRMARELMGRPNAQVARHGGLVDPRALENVVMTGTHWPSLGRNIRSGLLEGLSLSATEVATGRTVVFIQQHGGGLPSWTPEPNIHVVSARIGPRHALASAAIPLLFPPVQIGKRLFVDGGLRMNVPLSPALRMGATRVVVISLRYIPPRADDAPAPAHDDDDAQSEEAHYATAPFLVGKTLNALMLDSTDQDLGRLRAINAMLEAGTKAYGPGFQRVMSDAVPRTGPAPFRYVRNILIRPSQNIGKLAAEYASSPTFAKRARGLAGMALRRMVDRETEESDLLSYLMFDGGFAEMLIDLGRADARAQRAEWLKFWSEAPECAAEAAQWPAAA
jgi:NTE family protein